MICSVEVVKAVKTHYQSLGEAQRKDDDESDARYNQLCKAPDSVIIEVLLL